MGKLPKQTKRGALIRRFRELGFEGPYGGTGDHPQYMKLKGRVVKLPNPHRSDIGEGLLKIVLGQAGVTAEEWLGEPPKDEPEAEAMPSEETQQPKRQPRRGEQRR